MTGVQTCALPISAPLAIGPGNVHRRVSALGIPEVGEQRPRPFEAELETAGRSREEVLERVTIAGKASRATGHGQGEAHPVAAGRPDMCRNSWLTVRLRFRRCVTESSIPWSSRNSEV